MPPRFVDTNILIRYFTRDDETKASKALALLTRVERGQEQLETSIIVIFETVYALRRLYQVPKAQIHELVGNLIRLRGLHLPGKNLCLEALDLYLERNISFADCYNAVYMRGREIPEIYSWDTDFDKMESIIRVEQKNNTLCP